MYYELTIRYLEGRETVSYGLERRSEMLETAAEALRRWDVAYIHVSKRDDEGHLTNQKFIEGAAYDDFIANIAE